MKYVRRNIDMPLSYFVEEGDTDFFPILPGQTRRINLATGIKKYYQFLLNKVAAVHNDYGIINADLDYEEMNYQFVIHLETAAAVPLPHGRRARRMNSNSIIVNSSTIPPDILVSGPTPALVETKLYLKGVKLKTGTDVIFHRLTSKSDKYVLSIKNKSQTKKINGLNVKMSYVSTFPLLTRKIPMAFFQNAFDKIWNNREKRFLVFKSDASGRLFLYFDKEFGDLYGFPQYKVIDDPLPVVDYKLDSIDFSFRIFSRNRKPYIEWKITFKKGKLEMPFPFGDINMGDKDIIFEFEFPSLKVKCKFLDDIVDYFDHNLTALGDILVNQIAGVNEKVRAKRDALYAALNLGIYGYADIFFSWIMGRYDYLSVLYTSSNSTNINIYYTDFIPEKKDLADLMNTEAVVSKKAAKVKKAGPQLFAPGIHLRNPVPLHPNAKKVDHIVVLMMENRSYDQMLGYLAMKNFTNKEEINGLKGNESNRDANDNVFTVNRQTNTKIAPGPAHESENMLNQITSLNSSEIDMSGFVRDYAMRLKDYGWNAVDINRQVGAVMGYYTEAELPVTDYLAREFGICNQWYCSHPGPTLTNRFITLNGDVLKDNDGQIFENHPHFKDFRPVQQKTIFDYLTERKVSWNYFETEYCTLRLYGKYTFDMDNVVSMESFYEKAAAGNLPSVSFIDPDFIDIPPGNDDHPPADMRSGQALMQKIVKALQDGPAWNKTLLLITYDENGGFYDHVPPPELENRYSTNEATYGPRVPTFVISPYIPLKRNAITVSNKIYDHSSIGATILRRFCNKDVPVLSQAMNKANDVWDMLSLAEPRDVKKIKALSKGYMKAIKKEAYKFGSDPLEDFEGFHHMMLSCGFFFRS